LECGGSTPLFALHGQLLYDTTYRFVASVTVPLIAVKESCLLSAVANA